MYKTSLARCLLGKRIIHSKSELARGEEVVRDRGEPGNEEREAAYGTLLHPGHHGNGDWQCAF
jgi:hypothetical protein